MTHVSDENPSATNYNSLTTDEKLNLILSTMTKINNLESKLDRAISATNTLSETQETVLKHTDRITVLEYKSIDNEARVRRNNLLFKGLAESRNENCVEKILDFLQTELGIGGEGKMYMDRAHRLGRFRSGNTRFIIVAFTYFTDTEYILSKGHMLKNKPYSISRDFPHEIVQARKMLWPRYKDLRSRHTGIGNSVSIVYPAKLVHNGRVIVDMFPQWDEFMRRSRVSYKQVSEQLRSDSSQRTSNPPRATRSDTRVTHRVTATQSVSSDDSSDTGYTAMDITAVKACIRPYTEPTTSNAPHSIAQNPITDTPAVANEPVSPSLISAQNPPLTRPKVKDTPMVTPSSRDVPTVNPDTQRTDCNSDPESPSLLANSDQRPGTFADASSVHNPPVSSAPARHNTVSPELTTDGVSR